MTGTVKEEEQKQMTATVRFHCGRPLSENWRSGKFQVPITEVDGMTSWASLEYDQALGEAQAQHDAECQAPEHDIRTSISLHY